MAGALANTKTMTSEEVEVTFAAHLLFGAEAGKLRGPGPGVCGFSRGEFRLELGG